MKSKYLILLLQFFVSLAYSQNTIEGVVLDENKQPLPGAHVHCENNCTATDSYGKFQLQNIKLDKVSVTASFIGYEFSEIVLKKPFINLVKIELTPNIASINEVYVEASKIDLQKSRKNELITSNFLTNKLNGSFVKSIESISGVNSMDIGANSAKPVIRGMSFTRVVVSENGIKQEGQQWGADHGLEIDPFGIENAEIVKGASAIEFGSDAIGGYINILNDNVPAQKTLTGALDVLAKSVNQTLGGSLSLIGRKDKVFVKFRTSFQDYADYHLPTNKIVYLSRSIPIYNEQLKNTAGNEQSIFTQVGFVSKRIKSTLLGSLVRQKSGFFPGAHGMPDAERVIDDNNRRNIDLPYQNATHLKVINNNSIKLSSGKLSFDLGFQNNLRQEWSSFHTHYGSQKPPKNNKDLELDFRLQTYTANSKFEFANISNHKLSFGTQLSVKNNNISGYNFLLPAYNSKSLGVFFKDIYKLTEKIKITTGFRYDLIDLSIEPFYDTIVFNYFNKQTSEILSNANFYATRSVKLNKNYNDFSWLIGGVFSVNSQNIFRLNFGKAFRNPTAIELASNGIHHGSFMHEVGNSNLDSEKGFYSDLGYELKTSSFEININPYIYYFKNYIYLNPSAEWSFLPHAGQKYIYTQSKAIIGGAEFSFSKKIRNFKTTLNLEYIYNKRLTEDRRKRFPLPFTPPPNGFVQIEYNFTNSVWAFSDINVFANSKIALSQNRAGQNELTTEGYYIFGIGISSKILLAKQKATLIIQANNLLDQKYYNHISFYRKIQIPELGRNIQLTLKIPFAIK